MSLREKQKARRAREIIDAAAVLFGRNGYHSTTMEDIAEHAFVAPGTVYNYFGSKDGVLQGIVDIHISERRAERKRFLDAPPEDLDAAIVAYIDLLIDRAFVLVNREVWRQVLASGITGGTNRTDLHEDVTGALVHQFERLFSAFQTRGDLGPGVDIRDLSEAAMGIADFHFYRYVCTDTVNLDDTKSRIVRQIQLLLNGVRERH